MKPIKPYRQGDLDGLCGIYAVINAVCLISDNIKIEPLQDIFHKTIKLQIKHRKSVTFMVNGISQAKVARLMQRIIKPNFNIKYSRPYKTRKELSVPELWSSYSDYLNGSDKRCIIICYETKTYGHWSIVQAMTAKRLYLFDSSERVIINRRHISTTTLSDTTPILIDFTATFYLEGM